MRETVDQVAPPDPAGMQVFRNVWLPRARWADERPVIFKLNLNA
jgi:hypothetical protein